MKKKVFVSGATGFQGSAIARLFLAEGEEVVTLSPSAKEEKSIAGGLEIIKGDFGNEAVLTASLNQVETAVFTFPLIFDIEMAKKYTSNFIKAAKAQGVSLVIFNAGFDLPKEKTGLLGIDLKLAISSLFDQSNLDVITLIPDIYIDNLAAPWSIPVILDNGILPYPVSSGQKVPWISHVDLAKYVVSAAKKPALAGSKLPIGGNLFTGEEIAAAVSTEIGKPINFVGVAPDDFEKQIAPAFGDLAGKEISNLYRYISQHKEDLIAKDFQKTQQLLEVVPQNLTEWAKSVTWAVQQPA